MQHLFHELSVLAKAIHYKNLSGAAANIGLSQPQLSRIIARIEEELAIVVLDRSAKRKSGWTPVAFTLASAFEANTRRLETELMAITNKEMITELRIGTLEGMARQALQVSHSCFKELNVQKITLDMFDLNELEARFFSGDLDLMFTSKIPGKQKFKYYKEIGYQTMERIHSQKNMGVFSTWEFGKLHGKKASSTYENILISNSLSIRKDFLMSYGGTGYLPSEISKEKIEDGRPVMLIGSEILNPTMWNSILSALN